MYNMKTIFMGHFGQADDVVADVDANADDDDGDDDGECFANEQDDCDDRQGQT